MEANDTRFYGRVSFLFGGLAPIKKYRITGA